MVGFPCLLKLALSLIARTRALTSHLKIFSTLDQFDESTQLGSHFSSILISNSTSSSNSGSVASLKSNGVDRASVGGEVVVHHEDCNKNSR